LQPVGRTGASNAVWGNIRGILITDQNPTGANNTLSNPTEALKINNQTATNAIAIYQDGTGAYNKYEGFSMLGADGAPESPLEVNSTTSLGQQLVTLDQDDTDQPFIDFQGNTGANATASISTFTTGGTIQGYVQVEINGTKRWIPFYSDPTA
jgi:hypothetical protein